MLTRINRIWRVFGTEVLLRIVILLIGTIIMSIGGRIFLSSLIPAAITVCGLIVGYALRNQIAAGIDVIPAIVKFCLLIYGIVLFLGQRLELDYLKQLSIITATTVLIFDLQFWSRSDPRVTAILDEVTEDQIDK